MKRALGITIQLVILIIIVTLVLLVSSGRVALSDDQSIGDVNGSGSVNIADVVYALDYIFGGGPEPIRLQWMEEDTTKHIAWINGQALRVGMHPIRIVNICSIVDRYDTSGVVIGIDTAKVNAVLILDGQYMQSSNRIIKLE